MPNPSIQDLFQAGATHSPPEAAAWGDEVSKRLDEAAVGAYHDLPAEPPRDGASFLNRSTGERLYGVGGIWVRSDGQLPSIVNWTPGEREYHYSRGSAAMSRPIGLPYVEHAIDEPRSGHWFQANDGHWYRGLLVESTAVSRLARTEELDTAPWSTAGDGPAPLPVTVGGFPLWQVTSEVNDQWIRHGGQTTEGEWYAFGAIVARGNSDLTDFRIRGDETQVLVRIAWNPDGSFDGFAEATNVVGLRMVKLHPDGVYHLSGRFQATHDQDSAGSLFRMWGTTSVATEPGFTYWGFPQFEEAIAPSSYIRSGAAPATRQHSEVRSQVLRAIPEEGQTFYAKMIPLGMAVNPDTGPLYWALGSERRRIRLMAASSSRVRVEVRNDDVGPPSVVTVTNSSPNTVTYGDLLEAVVQVRRRGGEIRPVLFTRTHNSSSWAKAADADWIPQDFSEWEYNEYHIGGDGDLAVGDALHLRHLAIPGVHEPEKIEKLA